MHRSIKLAKFRLRAVRVPDYRLVPCVPRHVFPEDIVDRFGTVLARKGDVATEVVVSGRRKVTVLEYVG